MKIYAPDQPVCGCQYGGKCTKTTMCAVQLAVSDAIEEHDQSGLINDLECDVAYWKKRSEKFEAAAEELKNVFKHMHVNNNEDDRCKKCGLDLFHKIHLRIGEIE